MTCRMQEEHLHEWEEYLDGQLEPARARELSEHVASCRTCGEAVEAAKLAGRLLRAGSTRAAEAPEAFWTRLRATLRAEEERRRVRSEFWGSLEGLAWRLSWTAAVVVLLLSGYLVEQALVAPPPQAERQEIVADPLEAPRSQDEVLLSLANGKGR